MKVGTYNDLTPAEARVLTRVADTGRELDLRWNTVQAYSGQIAGYLRWLRRNEAIVRAWSSERKVETYLKKRVVHDRVGPVAREQAFYALLFLYGKVLRLPLGDIAKLEAIPHARRDKHSPAVLDAEQALAVIGKIEDSPWCPYRLMACLLFGCGLRVSEVLNLRVKDISLSESRATIRNTKGRSDRPVMLPCCVTIPLQRQIERVKLLWQQDRERGLAASMPGMDGLRRSRPSWPFALGWQYVFPQQTPCPNPQAWPGEEKILYRHHQHMSSLQKAVRAAAARCHLDGVVTPHTFRHAFASQLEWSGVHLTEIQALLGHKNIETTMIYVHRQQTTVRSPLDNALEGARALPRPPERPVLALPFPVA